MIGAISGQNTDLRRRPLGRLLIAGVMAWALFLQAFVTETHIHPEDTSPVSAIAATGTSGHHTAPTRDDPAKCPICQQIWRAGQYLAPSWASPLLLIREISYVEVATFARPRLSTFSHAWRSRGPPQH